MKRDRFTPDEVIIKYKQSVVDGKPKSQFSLPSSHYPKAFNFKRADA
jgi:hypothetical protein